MSAPFVLAVPSKGRLQENAAAFFARAGLRMTQAGGARDYRGAFESLDGVEVAYVSASEIVGLLATGQAHMGVTGEDLVRERIEAAEQRLEILAPLGFGHANVVVAVPQAWIDVRTMADLDDVAAIFYTRRRERMRVATKYKTLTRQFFAEKNVVDYRIVESSGATEGAPAAGQAELIVDITTTGATLAANSLKVLEDGLILRSEASLVASLAARWDDQAKEVARQLLGRIAAEESARLTRDVVAQFKQRRNGLVEEAAARFNASLRCETPNGGLTLVCLHDKVPPLADWLMAQGAHHVTVAAMDYVFAPTNLLHERLLARLV